LQILL